eukprot:2564362-Karenia_brevis.AAC.1
MRSNKNNTSHQHWKDVNLKPSNMMEHWGHGQTPHLKFAVHSPGLRAIMPCPWDCKPTTI